MEDSEEPQKEENKQEESVQPVEEPKAELKKEKTGWFKKKSKEEKPKQAEEKPSLGGKLKNKLIQYNRVLNVARKPDKTEFKNSTKITGVGILFVGSIGFIIFLIYQLVF